MQANGFTGELRRRAAEQLSAPQTSSTDLQVVIDRDGQEPSPAYLALWRRLLTPPCPAPAPSHATESEAA